MPRLKIGILSRIKELYSTRALARAARNHGHSVQVIDYLGCHLGIEVNHPRLFLGHKELNDFDAVIPRIGPQYTYFGLAVVRQFEMMSVYSLNESMAIAKARDKLRSLQLLARAGVGLPVTSSGHTPEAGQHMIETCGGAPLVIKLVEGTQGVGVVLTETTGAAESVIDAFRGLNAHMIAQEFISEAQGSDIRAFVIGNKVVAAIKRQAKPGDFRSNLHKGGKAEPIAISKAEREAAIKATYELGLSIAGVDMLRSKRGPLVLEVNASPGLEGIQRATKIDIADQIITYLEQQLRPGKRKKASG